MNAVILTWNPDISSFKKSDFLKGMEDFDHFGLNWSVWEHEKVHKYDRFFMLCVGGKNTGIVMSGLIVSDPYKGRDWSGKGRVVYYVDLRPSVMVNPESGLMMTPEELSEQIPGFDWTGGHSGRVLSEEGSVKLMNLWELHQDKHLDEFKDKHLVRRDDDDINPVHKLYCMKEFLKDYAFEVHTCADEGYDYLDDVSYCITLRNPDGAELFIDLEGEFKLSYGGWHTHYMASNCEFESLKENILSLLNNKFGAVTLCVDKKWFGSSTTSKQITTKEQAIEIVYDVLGGIKGFIREVHRKGVDVTCMFWDSKLNSTISLAPNEIPLPAESGVHIDLRPHYVFAYYEESSMFMNKSLLYYSRKDKSLHYRYKAGIGYWNEEKKDMERSVSISDEDAKALERAFKLMVETVKAYKGEPWFVCDGCEYVVISGRQRVRFAGPLYKPPYCYVNDLGNRLLEIMENGNQAEFDKAMKQVKEVTGKLETYIAQT